MRSRVFLVTVLALAMSVSAASTPPPQKSGPASRKAPGRGFDRYQVAAGTALLVKLRTPLSSATAAVEDQVEATLWSPVVQNGVELVPEGSTVFGKVIAVRRASERTPAGALEFKFSIIEHAGTGSRETLSTRTVYLWGTPVAQTGRGRGKARPTPVDAVMAEGTAFSAMTAEPLLVRIPR